MTGYSKEEVKKIPSFPCTPYFYSWWDESRRCIFINMIWQRSGFLESLRGIFCCLLLPSRQGKRKRLLVRGSFSILRFLFVSLECCGKAVSLWIARVERCGNGSCVRWDTSVSELAGKTWQQSPKFKNSPEWQWLPATLKKEDTALNCLRPEKTIVIP